MPKRWSVTLLVALPACGAPVDAPATAMCGSSSGEGTAAHHRVDEPSFLGFSAQDVFDELAQADVTFTWADGGGTSAGVVIVRPPSDDPRVVAWESPWRGVCDDQLEVEAIFSFRLLDGTLAESVDGFVHASSRRDGWGWAHGQARSAFLPPDTRWFELRIDYSPQEPLRGWARAVLADGGLQTLGTLALAD